MEDCGSSAILQYAKEALAENASLFPPEGRIFLCCGTDLPQSPDFPPGKWGAGVPQPLNFTPLEKGGGAVSRAGGVSLPGPGRPRHVKNRYKRRISDCNSPGFVV